MKPLGGFIKGRIVTGILVVVGRRRLLVVINGLLS